jgi:hypothetical protein
MQQGLGVYPSSYGVEHHGIRNVNTLFWNLRTAALVEQAIERREGLLGHREPWWCVPDIIPAFAERQVYRQGTFERRQNLVGSGESAL